MRGVKLLKGTIAALEMTWFTNGAYVMVHLVSAQDIAGVANPCT